MFVILGFSHCPDKKVIFFILFLCIYIITMLGNLIILLVINMNPVLHTPMYFFLRNLSFLEICYTSVTLPRVLVNPLSSDTSISFGGCAAQMYFFLFVEATECGLLAATAYDHYQAICNPLQYMDTMNKKVCMQLAASSWVCGNLVALGHTTFIFPLPFCGSNMINHLFCETQKVLMLVCGNTYWNELQIILAAAFVILMPFLLILVSYGLIISSILKIRSAKGRYKAFSTFFSHLTVVTLFCETAVLIYLRPKSSYSLNVDKVLSLFYSVVNLILKPVVYSFRNREVKGALFKMRMKLFRPNS
ncbi:LOW QUALITY PROTEIN: olfactory receptor 10C1-like [Caloenas nicobarica]|uniref:LOW QUALITY PROTEIN: olfactory receptor 10C1-like n=1 Tax=Caloenas nicobarica TaxID=187106 RepID=UPI0032B74E85